MKIAIDLNRMRLAASGGMAIFVRELLREMVSASNAHDFLIYCTPASQDLVRDVHAKVRVFPYWSYGPRMDESLAREAPHVLLRVYPFLDQVRFAANQQVVVVPDLQHEAMPDLFHPAELQDRRIAHDRALAQAGAIVTLSEFTAGTIRQHPSYCGQTIAICNPTLPTPGRPVDPEVPRPYFLYPANLWPHKNHARLLRAFAKFNVGRNPKFHLVLTGHPDGWAEKAGRLPHANVLHLGFVDDNRLAGLFQDATGLVFFSLYEGFGIPVLQAFHWSTPVACSNRTSLPEVVGDAALLCNPENEDDMAKAMARLAEDAGLRQKLVEVGHHRLSRFNITASASNLMQVLEQVGRSPPALRRVPKSRPPDYPVWPFRRGIRQGLWQVVRPAAHAIERARLVLMRPFQSG